MTPDIALVLGILAVALLLLVTEWSQLSIEREAPVLHDRLWEQAALHELVIADEALLVGERLRHREFRERYAANVLAVRHGADSAGRGWARWCSRRATASWRSARTTRSTRCARRPTSAT